MSRSFRRSLRVAMTWTAILMMTVEPSFAGSVLNRLRGCGGGGCSVGGRLQGAMAGLRCRAGGLGACASCGGDCGGGCGARGRVRGMVHSALSHVRGMGSRLRCRKSRCDSGCQPTCEVPVASCGTPVQSCGCSQAIVGDVVMDSYASVGEVVSDGGYVDSGYVDSGYVDNGYVDSGYVDSGYVDSGYVDGGYVSDAIVMDAVTEGVVYGDDYSYTGEVVYQNDGCSSCSGDVVSNGIPMGGEVYSEGAVVYDSGYSNEVIGSAPMGCVDGNCGNVVTESMPMGDVIYGDTITSDVISEDSGTIVSDSYVDEGSTTRMDDGSATRMDDGSATRMDDGSATRVEAPMNLDLGGGSDLVADPPETAPAPTTPAPADSGAFQPVPGDDDLLGDEGAAAGGDDNMFGEAVTDDLPADTDADASDDLFPADDAAPAGADPADDLFPADDAAPADGDAPEEGGSDIDDLFGSKSQLRTWVDNTGNFSTEGRLVEFDGTKIRLLKSNGRHCTVPLRRLSEADFQLVQKIASLMGKAPIARVAAR